MGGIAVQEAVKLAWEFGRGYLSQGRVADYIPELDKADPGQLGLCLKTIDGRTIEYGDVERRFTMQSICKVVSLAVALQSMGEEKVFSRVSMEPSGDAFNSIIKLDTVSDRPFNPMINAGAISVVGLLTGKFRFEELLAFVRKLCQDDRISINDAVYLSEKTTGNRNRAIGYILKSKDMLEGDVQKAVDLYFRLCSLNINTRSLAGLGLVLANGGVEPSSGVRYLDERVVRTVTTLMFTCGMYDGSGEFAVRVGIPSKSGVGGGILSCVQGCMGIGTYGPALEEKGNSVGGIHMLEYLSRRLHLHMFDLHTSCKSVPADMPKQLNNQ